MGTAVVAFEQRSKAADVCNMVQIFFLNCFWTLGEGKLCLGSKVECVKYWAGKHWETSLQWTAAQYLGFGWPRVVLNWLKVFFVIVLPRVYAEFHLFIELSFDIPNTNWVDVIFTSTLVGWLVSSFPWCENMFKKNCIAKATAQVQRNLFFLLSSIQRTLLSLIQMFTFLLAPCRSRYPSKKC